METIIRIAQLLLSLSILVILHEGGHFFFAKLFKTRVEKFYMFFDPWFSLFKFKKGDTEYGIGWIPLGGYVKISGMIDESMDTEQLKQAPQPWEFRSKPAWQRLLIMLGGVLVNVLLAFVIYIFILWGWGERYLPNSALTNGIMVDSIGQELGLQNGDKILSIDGKTIEQFKKIPAKILLGNPKTIEIERNGQQKTIPINTKLIPQLLKDPTFIFPRIPFVVSNLVDNMPAQKAGLQPKDKIVAINNTPIRFFDEAKALFNSYKGQTVSITIERKHETITKEISISSDGKIGIYHSNDIASTYHFKTKEYSFFQAIPAGIVKTIQVIDSYIKQLKLIFTPSTGAYKSVGGFIAIGKIFPGTWDWLSFWSLTAFLSIMLAVLNLLPIPGLDGGHVLFTLWEMVSGKKPSDKFLEYAQMVGLGILLLLVLYANGNDIVKLFMK